MIRALLEKALADGVCTTASLAVVRDGVLVLHENVPAGPRVFDVASVTKVATATLAVSVLHPDERVEWLAPRPTVRELLSHDSGLDAWRPLFAHAARTLGVPLPRLVADEGLQAQAREIVRGLVGQLPPSAPRPTYSDVNFLALGFELEARTGKPLPQLAAERLFAPLGLGARWGGACPEAVRTGRGRPRRGNPKIEEEIVAGLQVEDSDDCAADDDNAACMGGRTGHAGLWATATDIARLGDALRRAAEGGPGAVIAADRARLLFTPSGAGTRTFGLDAPSAQGSSLGTRLGRGPRGAAGHLGFTGCSLWMDRDERLSVALLTDAVRMERPSLKIRAFRPVLHDALATALGIGAR